MDKYFTKEQVMNAMGEQNLILDDIWGVEQRLDELPVTDVAPVVHGEWRYVGSNWECSNCLFPVYSKSKFYRYCLQCGARMDGEYHG